MKNMWIKMYDAVIIYATYTVRSFLEYIEIIGEYRNAIEAILTLTLIVYTFGKICQIVKDLFSIGKQTNRE